MSAKTLQITESNARAFFKDATGGFKASLIDTFGEEFFKQKITDRVKSFEDACAENGTNPNDARFKTGDASTIAFNRCKEIAKSLKQGVKMSYKDTNTPKWYCVLQYVEGVGFRFWGSNGGYVLADAPGGSALCFPTQELAEYFYKNFIHELTPFYEHDNAA